jgi:RNA polymerase sigma-70 factor (ECF subfamily)
VGRAVGKDLIDAAKSGDTKAWRELIEATQNRLFRFCLVLCGDPVKAEDLCQEAFLKTFDKLSKLEKPDSFMDWLFRMTRNLYIDQYRVRKETEELPAEEGGAAPQIAEHIAVHQTLSQFEPDDRYLLMLVDMEEYSYKEAGEVLGISEDAVRSRLFRLRKLFVEKYGDPETK